MFSILKGLSVLCAVASVFATPTAEKRTNDVVPSLLPPTLAPTSLPTISLDKWGGFDSLSGFDAFYGAGNFGGFFDQNQVIVAAQQVCRRQDIIILHQQLAIIQELTKKIILSQICEVEVQVIFLQQFLGGFDLFHDDLFRRRGREPFFDASIVGHAAQLFGGFGGNDFNFKDFGFRGADIGKNKVAFNSNFKADISPNNLELALRVSKSASFSTRFF
jgi:hypothetical protein